MKNLSQLISGLLCLSSMAAASSASAALSNVIPIPWEGDITKFHTAVPGQSITVKGLIKTTDTTTISNQWNFGDGSPFSSWTTMSGQTRYLVSATHTYSGSVGTPFVAWLIASDGTTSISNRYLVQLQAAGLAANINIAIDNGLWYLYQTGNYVPAGSTATSFNTMDQTACVYWNSSGSLDGTFYASPTGSALQAFEINGSLATGDFNQDPYAELVAGGLNFLFKGFAGNTSEPVLQAVNIAPRAVDPQNNPDSNGNGIGVQVFDTGGSTYTPYQGGMVMDAIVAAGTPSASTGRNFTGTNIATYKDVVQDMCDMYAWGEDVYSFGAIYPTALTSVPAGTPDSVTFTMFDLSCANGGIYTFYINGQPVATNPVPLNCNCSGTIHSVLVDGSTLTAAWGLSASPTLSVTYDGGTGYGPSWVHARLDYSGSEVALCVTNFNSAGCDNSSSVCNGYAGTHPFDASNFVSSFPVLQNDVVGSPVGAWHYYWQYADPGDNSASQWAAIGQIAAEQPPFNCIVPQFVKTYDNNYLNYSYTTDNGGLWGHFGYNSPGQFVQNDYHGDATTPSGMVQMIFDGFTTSDPRWVTTEAWLAQNWDSQSFTGSENWIGNVENYTVYPAYSCAKAMRLAQPSPVVTFATNGFDWYFGNASDPNGLAKTISDELVASGYRTYDYWAGPHLATAWAVIILKPNLFSAGPTACFSDNPNPNFANEPTYFDPSCSTDPKLGGISNITEFVWNWGDGTPNTTNPTPEVVTHSFACTTLPCSYVVTLTVTDNSTPPLTSSDQQTINITEPPHPPVAVIGGPYIVSLCPGDTLTLDGSGSYTPDQGLSQANCNSCPPDHLTAYGWALRGAPYVYTDNTDTNADLGTGFTTYFPSPGAYPIALEVADDASLSFPGGATSNLTADAFGWVTNYAAGPCMVNITGGCQDVALNWNSTGATQVPHVVLASVTGPNAGFTVVGSTGGTNITIPATLGQSVWYRVQGYPAAGGVTMSGAMEFSDVFNDCVCIGPVTIQTKNVEVALSWPAVAGASCFNIYRGTAPGVALVKANRIAACVGVPNNDYTDLNVVNGKTYYYQITEVVNGVEVCRSAEVHGKPAATSR